MSCDELCVFLENCVSCRWTLRISRAWDAFGIYVFLVNGVGRLWNLRISREWRGALMEFAYFSRMTWETYVICVFLQNGLDCLEFMYFLENDVGCCEIYVFLGNGVGFTWICGIS